MGILANLFFKKWLMQDFLAYQNCIKKNDKIAKWPQTYILQLAYYL